MSETTFYVFIQDSPKNVSWSHTNLPPSDIIEQPPEEWIINDNGILRKCGESSKKYYQRENSEDNHSGPQKDSPWFCVNLEEKETICVYVTPPESTNYSEDLLKRPNVRAEILKMIKYSDACPSDFDDEENEDEETESGEFFIYEPPEFAYEPFKVCFGWSTKDIDEFLKE